MIYIVLGMHKSGTTLVSQLLHHAGINMGDDLEQGVSYDQGNQYERASTWHLNKDILAAHGQISINIRRPAALTLTPAQRQCRDEIIATCNHRYADWGFKDPRTCLVYPLWADALPAHKLIIVYRDPNEPWPRYRPRHTRNRYREPFLAWKYLKSWCEHNQCILDVLRTTSHDYLVLEYQALVTTQTEFDRLQAFVGRDLVDRRKPKLYRNRARSFRILSMMEFLLQRRHGYHPQVIMQQLEAYRHEHEWNRVPA